MQNESRTEQIDCPYCSASSHVPWATENGFLAVKCSDCSLIYVNPRPIPELVVEGVETGVHSDVPHNRTAINRYKNSKVSLYKDIIGRMYSDVWSQHQRICWLDVGAGYGEVVEAISALAAEDSRIEGIEPMKPKANWAQAHGLCVRQAYLEDIADASYEYLSLINVFSHIPDFRSFLQNVRRVLKPNGEFFIETGNIADLTSPRQVPSELDLPDHLVFAGEQHIIGFLTEAGFEVLRLEKHRRDGVLTFGKNIVKKMLGRSINLVVPYTSPYRTMLVRARANSEKY